MVPGLWLVVSRHRFGYRGGNRREQTTVIEPILLGMVVGLVPVTIAGLLVAAWLQYKEGNPSGLGEK